MINRYDNLIKKVFFKDNCLSNKYFKRFFKNPKKYENKYLNIKKYLNNRYNDSKDIRETLYRIYRNIEIRPKCKICGKELNLCIINKKNQVFPIYCSISCEMKDPEVMKKHNESCFKKYGSINNSAKTKETCLKKYGVKAGFNNGKEKITKLNKYGNENYVNSKKAKETCLKKYGVISPLCLNKTRNARKSKESLIKEYNTKKKNHTFNSSNLEDKSYKLLLSRFNNNVEYQYKSDQYPFVCDFYIPVIDTYIECNFHWTHSGHLFDKNSKEDQDKLESWKTKKTKYYDNAIETWTIRDVNKNDIAIKNNLNYLVFYSYDDLCNWVNNLDLTIWYDEDILKKEFEYYLKTKGNLNKNYTNSYIIKYFQQDIFYKKEKELWRDDNIKNKLINNRIKYLDKPLEELTDIDYLNGFKRSMIYYGYSYFNPLWFKWFIEKYNIKKCYDPFGGWGHRLLGGISLLDLYIYNDLSKTTYENVNKIISFFDIKNVVTYNEDSNNFIPKEEFDSMFTCPPYYNVEKYECDEFKNIEEYYKLIDNIFNLFYSTNDCKIFGIVIREDLLKDIYQDKAIEKILINFV